MTNLSMEERKEILKEEIMKYVKDGWQVVSQFDTSAQLTRETGPSCGIALLLSLLLLLPAILYLIFYKGKEIIFIEVDGQGEIHKTLKEPNFN